MRKIAFILIFFLSIIANAFFVYDKIEKNKQKEEFFSLFKLKNITYNEGLKQLEQKINLPKKDYRFIHMWDTTFVEFGMTIPYILQIDSFFRTNNLKNIECVLVSSMREKTINQFLTSHNIKLTNTIIINDMDDFVSGISNKQKRKSKVREANLLIDRRGNFLYYNDKIINTFSKDSVLLNMIYHLK
jgi:hypothetical protein